MLLDFVEVLQLFVSPLLKLVPNHLIAGNPILYHIKTKNDVMFDGECRSEVIISELGIFVSTLFWDITIVVIKFMQFLSLHRKGKC